MLLEAWIAERRNDLGAAEDAYRRALEVAGRIGFADHISFALVRLGSNALARGDTRQAERPRLARGAARSSCGDLSDTPGRAALVGAAVACGRVPGEASRPLVTQGQRLPRVRAAAMA
jgi:hypothetical protein